MSPKEVSKHYGLPAAILAILAIGFWLMNVGFISRKEYDRDQTRFERKMDCALFNLPKGCRDTMAPREP